jgi:hypothetical protein
MTSLILHVGPAKCGSKSIQHFFATHKKPCFQNTRFAVLNPGEIAELNCPEPGTSISTVFSQLLSDNLVGCDVLILSHEYLFQCPYAIKHICLLAKNMVTTISIIGYSRRQSDFLISEYSQWGFRSPDRIEEASDALDKLGLDPVLFSGLERQLICAIVNDFYTPALAPYSILDWYKSYRDVLQLVNEAGAVIKCGILPSTGSDNILIQDFCEKAGLTLYDYLKDASHPIVNIRFNQDIIEAVNNAVALGLDMPGIHESNEALELLSAKMAQMKSNSSEFLSDLKSYVDAYFAGSNRQFCREYGLNEAYFAASMEFSKQEVLDIIVREGQQRALNKSNVISNYRMLGARMVELCLKLSKEQ